MLRQVATPSAGIEITKSGWLLRIPPGNPGIYRLAQLDDYSGINRKQFPITTPASISLTAKSSSNNLPGTWGFGFWNDPFGFSAGFQGKPRRVPTLPNACWFFHASKENHLSFNNKYSGNGFLCQTFRSISLPSLFLLPGILAAPLLYAKPFSRLLRQISSKFIFEDSRCLEIDTTQWHKYKIDWEFNNSKFSIDGQLVFQTNNSPSGPLGTVIWIDNQYAYWGPSGRFAMGTLGNANSNWIQIENLVIENGIERAK